MSQIGTKFTFCVLLLKIFLHESVSLGPSHSPLYTYRVSNLIIESESAPEPEEPAMDRRQGIGIPVVINTWGFAVGTEKAWEVISSGGSALDAVEAGATICEEKQCDGTVGFGGSPDENGETTLDAMIMDGETHSVGAVGCLRRVKNAVGVARKVMEHTKHTLLVGDLATEFAVKMGFPEESLETLDSIKMHLDWKAANCQPNFWKNVSPDPTKFCGPYSPNATVAVAVDDSKPSKKQESASATREIDRYNHDTIGIVAIDSLGRVASATSSNGARNKVPGRVGDAPIVGAGGYVDREIGGAAATGDGDIMVRFLPSLLAVEKMGNGASPQEAADEAIAKIARYYPSFSGALVAVNLKGEYGAACHNINGGFPYCVFNPESGNNVTLHRVDCITIKSSQTKLPQNP